MARQNESGRGGTPGGQQQMGVGRLANTSENPEDKSVLPGVEKPIASPAQQVAQADAGANPPTVDGGQDGARIVPTANQGDATDIVEKTGGEAGETIY